MSDPTRQPAASAQPEGAPGSAAGGSSPPRRRLWRAIWFTIQAVEIRLRFIFILVAVGLIVAFLDRARLYWELLTRPEPAVEAEEGFEFYCPMHPHVVRDRPDPGGKVPKCPICGMPLSKRPKTAAGRAEPTTVRRVQLSPYLIQAGGILTVPVTYLPLQVEVRTVGYIAYDESRLSQIVARFSGYVEELYVSRTYDQVEEGQPLAKIYSPEILADLEALRAAVDRGSAALVESSRTRLRLLGVAESDLNILLDRFRNKQPVEQTVLLRSPRKGHVIRKEIVQGKRIEMGHPLFEVADLSVVWMEAEVFERDLPWVEPGRSVEATVEALPGEVFHGRVALVYPELNAQTRTARIRMELDNPHHRLRPGMYATAVLKVPAAELPVRRARRAALLAAENAPDEARLEAQKLCPVSGAQLGSMGTPVKQQVDGHVVYLCCKGCIEKLLSDPQRYLKLLAPPPEGHVLAVPESAVIDTGKERLVYVEREPGVFEAVAVEVGPRAGEYYPVLEGLLPGQQVAAAGAFLIDAETRLTPAAAAAYYGAMGSPRGEAPPAPTSPHTHPAAPREATPLIPPGTKAPSRGMLESLEELPPEDRNLARQQQRCPVSNQPLGSMGVPFKVTVQGEQVFLCCEGCKDKLLHEPHRFLRALRK
jgi:Cu(I)/Ag(I) efflux system membrane fusion protein